MFDLSFSPSVPDYAGGYAASALYNCGGMIADDREHETVEDSPMLLITDTCESDFTAYLDTCTKAGFAPVFENDNSAFRAVQLEKDGIRLHVCLTKAAGQVRLIEDRAGVSLAEFSYSSEEKVPAEIVQYALYYDPKNDCTDRTVNCGMLYIVKLADNSLFVMDGGHRYQCSDEAVDGMAAFMRKLTGAKDGEPVRIAAWYVTHAHGDHMAACPRLLRKFPGQFRIERFMANLPSYQTRPGGYDPDIFILKDTLREYCPDMKLLKLHTGQKFTLANTTFEVLYTHEDAVQADNPTVFPMRDFNCTSTILKMTTDGGSVMWLGDTNVELERLMAGITTPELWKADVVQVAHHCFNYLTTLYAWIDADWAMLPNSYFGGHTPENTPKLADVIGHLASPENIYYEEKTTVFRFEDGKYTVLYEEDLIGGEWDGVDLCGVKHEI